MFDSLDKWFIGLMIGWFVRWVSRLLVGWINGVWVGRWIIG